MSKTAHKQLNKCLRASLAGSTIVSIMSIMSIIGSSACSSAQSKRTSHSQATPAIATELAANTHSEAEKPTPDSLADNTSESTVAAKDLDSSDDDIISKVATVAALDTPAQSLPSQSPVQNPSQSNLPGITIDSVSADGDGCPVDSYAIDLAPDAKAFTILFSDFSVDKQGDNDEARVSAKAAALISL